MSERGEIRGIKAAIFDLDGTLLDSVGLWTRIDEQFLRLRGLSPTEEYIRGLAALGNREVAEFTVKFYSLDESPEALMREWTDMARHEYATNIKLFRGAREYLLRTRERGIKLFVVTSLARELAENGLNGNGIASLFDGVFTCDETGLSKRDKAVYMYVADKAGVKPCECVAFDDVAAAVRAAKDAGMTAVAIHGDNKYYGDMSGSNADYVVGAVADAPELYN